MSVKKEGRQKKQSQANLKCTLRYATKLWLYYCTVAKDFLIQLKGQSSMNRTKKKFITIYKFIIFGFKSSRQR